MDLQLTRRHLLALGGGIALGGATARAGAQDPPLRFVPRKALAPAATELPFGPWGPWARRHAGPCFLAARIQEQVFAFPIVVGQRRDSLRVRTVRTPEGKLRVERERVVRERRALGLSYAEGGKDDAGASFATNRQARALSADGDALLWSTRIPFAPADEESAAPSVSPRFWGEGEAEVAYFPAYVGDYDGLLVRVALTNRSQAAQTWFVDLLGGAEPESPGLDPTALDLATAARVEAIGEGNKAQAVNTHSVTLRHPRAAPAFALAAEGRSAVRTFRVGAAYFAPEAAVSRRNSTNIVIPPGLAPPNGKLAAQGPGDEPNRKPAPQNPESQLWGLCRLDDLNVEPGETVEVFLSVGIGSDTGQATEAAQALLTAARGIRPDGKARAGGGAWPQVLRKHEEARWHGDGGPLAALMAQSLFNTPFHEVRRVGVATRQPAFGWPPASYEPVAGGFMAWGWTPYRSELALAQLNAFYQTQGRADEPAQTPRAVPPVNLLALWEFWQAHRSRDTLSRFYPFARRAHEEFLAAGRTEKDGWLFAWPAPPGEKARRHAPDYSAWVALSARILRQMALLLDRPADAYAYAMQTKSTVDALNTRLWNPDRGAYLSRNTGDDVTLPPPDVADALVNLFPLLAGASALPVARRATLLKSLSDPAGFRSPRGLRSLAKNSPAFRPDAADGSVAFGENALFWKALLDLNEPDIARQLAVDLLKGYEVAHRASGGTFPEWLNGENGAGGGATDVAADACALLPMWAAYHVPGTVTTGWGTTLRDVKRDADTLRIVFEPLDAAEPVTLLCVLGKFEARYTLSGAITGTAQSDASGLITLRIPPAGGAREISITPASL